MALAIQSRNFIASCLVALSFLWTANSAKAADKLPDYVIEQFGQPPAVPTTFSTLSTKSSLSPSTVTAAVEPPDKVTLIKLTPACAE